MMKLIYTITILLFSTTTFASIFSVVPPDSTTNVVDKSTAIYLIEEGKTLFLKGQTKGALIKFREAANKDANSWKASYWIAQCHYALNNFGYALKYAKKSYSTNPEKVSDEIYCLLGETYHRLGNIDTALINYELAKEKLSKTRSRTLTVDLHIEECYFAKEQMKDSVKFKKTRLVGDINSGFDDYGVILTDDGKVIYFTSRRSNTTGGGVNPDDERYFEDVYKVTWDEETNEWTDITNKLGRINSNGFDALNYLSPDGLWAIMTLNSTMSDAKKTTRGSDLCEIKMSNKGVWNSPKIINNKSVNTSFFEGSATLTADGNTMYFVTDRKGEKSSTDIYVVHREGKKWGTAKPLPFTINTKGRETTPFITSDGRYLFFSSNGHVGLGGMDVYVVENLGDSWGEPINLGYGVNTVNNDTHFSIDLKTMMAFVSGFEIIGKKSSIDIYQIDMKGFSFPKQ